MEVNGAPELLCFPHSSEYLPLCSAEQRHSYRFRTTWGWVNGDRIFIFGWTIPLTGLTFQWFCSYFFNFSAKKLFRAQVCHFYFFFVVIAIYLCSKTLKNVHFIQEILFFLSKQNNKAFYLLLFFMSAKCEMFIKYFLTLKKELNLSEDIFFYLWSTPVSNICMSINSFPKRYSALNGIVLQTRCECSAFQRDNGR